MRCPPASTWACLLLPEPLREEPACRLSPGRVFYLVHPGPVGGEDGRHWTSQSCPHTLLSHREGAELLVLQPWPQHARASPPGCPNPDPHQWHVGPAVFLRPRDANVWVTTGHRPQPWEQSGDGEEVLPWAPGIPVDQGAWNPRPQWPPTVFFLWPHPAPSQSAWRTHTSLTGTSSGSGLSPEALMEPS